MTTGAQRAGAHPDQPIEGGSEDDWTVVPMSGDYGAADQWPEAEPAKSPLAIKVFGAALFLLALAWIGGSIWVAINSETGLTPEAAVRWVPVVCAPLILIALLWIMLGRTPRRETERF